MGYFDGQTRSVLFPWKLTCGIPNRTEKISNGQWAHCNQIRCNTRDLEAATSIWFEIWGSWIWFEIWGSWIWFEIWGSRVLHEKFPSSSFPFRKTNFRFSRPKIWFEIWGSWIWFEIWGSRVSGHEKFPSSSFPFRKTNFRFSRPKIQVTDFFSRQLKKLSSLHKNFLFLEKLL